MELLRRLRIGNVFLANNLILSPMAGFSDLAFRVLCHEGGAGLVCSEMVAAGGVGKEAVRPSMRSHTSPEERPNSIQIFGTDPEQAAEAARVLEADCDVLGFNMGCPAEQIRRTGCGAALLDHPGRCVEIIHAIKAAARKPLLVKMRAGNEKPMDVVAFARALEGAGADGLIFHARTARQHYSGRADWSLIRQVKDAVSVPVIGNGDVSDGVSAASALRESGADGIAIGRAALGDPTIFRRIKHYLESGAEAPPPTVPEKARLFLKYLDHAERLGYERARILQQSHKFTRGVPGGAALRTALQGSEVTVLEVRNAFESLRTDSDAATG